MRRRRLGIVLIGLALVAGTELPAQVSFDRLRRAADEPHNWLTYSGSYSSQRFSTLRQITPDNVSRLRLEWVYQAQSAERSDTKFEATPLVVDGMMYTVRPPNDVVALDAATGQVEWTKPYPVATTVPVCCGRVNRGLAVLGDTLFMGTLDGHLLAINAKDGRTLWKVAVGRPEAGYSLTHAPLVIKDTVIAGPAGGEYGIRGFLAAFDAKTGTERWRFYTIPGPGEPGFDSWSGDSWKTGGGAIWMTGSYDPDTNLTYWGTGNPAPVYNGDSRLGDNLYTDSVVALDADTGKLKWHYQFTPHDEQDLDSAQPPVLADLIWQGRPRKLLLWANKNRNFYVLDRTTGELLLRKPYGMQANWLSPSFNPSTGLFYIPGAATVVGPGANFVKGPAAYVQGQQFMGGRNQPPGQRSGQPPPAEPPVIPGRRVGGPAAAVIAISPATGDPTWRVTVKTAGLLTTASGVLFTGDRDGYFRALDARTGRELWKMLLASAGLGTFMSPMTYAVNGHQYVSIAVGNGLFTFGLQE
jgi:alcohol dehydrogenase (cytochrome c)